MKKNTIQVLGMCAVLFAMPAAQADDAHHPEKGKEAAATASSPTLEKAPGMMMDMKQMQEHMTQMHKMMGEMKTDMKGEMGKMPVDQRQEKMEKRMDMMQSMMEQMMDQMNRMEKK